MGNLPERGNRFRDGEIKESVSILCLLVEKQIYSCKCPVLQTHKNRGCRFRESEVHREWFMILLLWLIILVGKSDPVMQIGGA